MALERVCPECGYRTTRPADLCPICNVSLRTQGRGWLRRRRVGRVPLPAGVPGTLDDQIPVTVLNLSPLGACLEHAEPLLPVQPCLLTLPLPDAGPLCLPADIVWTQAQPVAPDGDGAQRLYRSGVEFRDVPPAMAQALDTYLGRVAGSLGALSPD